MHSGVLLIFGMASLVLVSCDRPAAGPTMGEEPKQIIDASKRTRAETEKKLEEQRQAIKAALGEDAAGSK
jgi:hypothetical protein